jgi:hypothetical protein
LSLDARHDRLLWLAALSIYAVMRGRDDLARVSRVAAAWDYLTSDTRELFPLLLMEPVQTGVTERLTRIVDRSRRGLRLCPELDA